MVTSSGMCCSSIRRRTKPNSVSDADGKAIQFPEPWPCNYLSMHSPFRQKGQDQVREILSRYSPISGLWLDIKGGTGLAYFVTQVPDRTAPDEGGFVTEEVELVARAMKAVK